MSKMTPKSYIEMISNSVGKFMNLETMDGQHRKGKISGLVCKEIFMNGQLVSYPVEIELNSDAYDLIPLDRVLRISIQPDIKDI